MNRHQLLSILKINGYDLSATDEEIRAVLNHAKYSESEIETALQILREQPMVEAGRVDGLHRIFYTDGSLRPNEISSLLGVDMNLNMPISRWTKSDNLTLREVLTIVIGSVAIATMTILTYMFLAGVGLFHNPVL
jgi:predicted transcriptional regulator